MGDFWVNLAQIFLLCDICKTIFFMCDTQLNQSFHYNLYFQQDLCNLVTGESAY